MHELHNRNTSILRQVIIKMCKFNKFITAVCVLFLIKLRWPKNKSIYDTSIVLRSTHNHRLYFARFFAGLTPKLANENTLTKNFSKFPNHFPQLTMVLLPNTFCIQVYRSVSDVGGGGEGITLHPIQGGESKFTPSLFILMPQKPSKAVAV